MPYDPQDVLGTNQVDPGKGAKHSSPGFDPLDVKAAAGPTLGNNMIAGTIDPNTKFSDFRFQPKTNANNYLLRAQDQGFWESMGKTIGNVAANIPLDIVQGVGYLGTMLEFGDDRDYTNALVQGIDKIKSPLGEVYQEHPEKYFDMTDSAWWMNNLGGLVESAASFAVEGAGIAKLFGTIAKGAAWSARAGKLASKAAQGLSAATLTYMEGAMSGANVFETAYNNNYMKMIGQGIDASEADQQAKHVASQAAAATVQLHTAMNLALNVTGLTPMFRDPDQAIVRWWRKNGAALPGESSEQWMARIGQAVPEGMPLKKLLGLGMEGPSRLGLEAFQEGLEEVNTQYAEHVGKAIGEGKEKKDVTGRLADADRYFSEVLNQEGALNMALGAIGGIAQTTIMDHIPVHKVIKYGSDGKPLMTEQGQPQTERISSHTMNERMNRQYFDNIKDALSKDMQWLGAKNKEMEEALKNKDLATLARTRADLLSVHNLRAVSMGMGDMWKQQYQDIASLDNTKSLAEDLNPAIQELDKQIEEDRGTGDTEAMNQKTAKRYELLKQQTQLQDVTEAIQKGYAQDKSDNSYKERAMQAVQNLDYLTKLYEDMHDKYTGTEEMEAAGLAEHMFYRQANLYLHKQQLDMMDQDLMKLRGRIDEMTLSTGDNILVKQAQEFLTDKEVWDTTVKKLNNDIQRINEAIRTKNDKVFLQILDKYKIPATKDAAGKLIETLERRKKELQDRADYTNKELNDTIAVWKETNPGKEVKDVIQKASERPALEDIYKQNKAYHAQGVTEYETAKEQLSKDTTNKGIQEFLKENKPKDTKKQFDKEHIDAYSQQVDREVAANLDAKQKQQLVTKLDERITEINKQTTFHQGQLQELTRYRNNLKGFKNFNERQRIKKEMIQKQSKIHGLNFELSNLTQRRNGISQQAQQATQQAQNVSRTPPVIARVIPPVQGNAVNTPATSNDLTPTVPGYTLAQVQQVADKYGPDFNNVKLQEELHLTDAAGQRLYQAYIEATASYHQQPSEDYSDNPLPDFDFAQEVIPAFTTPEEGHQIFDKIMGGNEAGNTIRQFIKLRKDAQLPFLINGIRTMIERTNLPMPTAEEFSKFIEPYVSALKEQYMNQKLNPEQEYEGLKSFLKPELLTVLDILEQEFRTHGFSYDRIISVLNQQVAEGNLQKSMVGTIANQMKAYLEVKEDPVIDIPQTIEVQVTTPIVEAPIAPVQPAITAATQQKRQEVRVALQRTGQGEGGQFYVTLVDGKRYGSGRITLVNNEIQLSDGSTVDIELINKIENPDGTVTYDNTASTKKEVPITSVQPAISSTPIEKSTIQSKLDQPQALFERFQGILKNPNVQYQDVKEYIDQYLADRNQLSNIAVEVANSLADTSKAIPVSFFRQFLDSIGSTIDYESKVDQSIGTKSQLVPEVLPIKGETADQLVEWIRSKGIQQKYKSQDALQRLYESVKDGTYRKSGQYSKEVLDEVESRLKSYLYPSTQPIVNSREFNEDPGTYIAPTTDSEPTTFSNASLNLEQVQQENKVFVGASNVEAIKANFNTHPYKEFDNGSDIRIVSDYTQLDPHLNTDVLIPGVIVPGDQVIFEVDENWSGEINYDTEMRQDEYGEQLRRADMFQNYLDAPGKIGMASSATHPKGAHANVPIKIIHQSTGKVIGYLPRADWILAKYPDTGNYRNVVDEYRDDQIEVTDNVARQYARIMKLRDAIVRSWNTDKSLKLNSTIAKRGTGHVMINRETNPNTGRQKLVSRSAKNMLPDTSLEIAILKQGSAYVASGTQSQKQLAKLPSYMQQAISLPVAMLPSPDGTFVPTPLYTHRLGDNPSSMNTVVSAIEIYLRNATNSSVEYYKEIDTKAIARIQEATGFDIRGPEGLRNFMQQYFTYTQKFGEKDTVITPSEVQGNATAQFMLDIPDLQPGEKVAFIKIGTSFSGEKPIYAQLVNGELHPDFEQALRDGLANRFKSVIFAGKQLRGINSQGEFKAPIIKKDGTVQVNTYQDYNEFVKANSTTFAYGLNKVGDQYVYMANPVVQLDYEKALKTALPVVNTTLTQEAPKTEDENIQEPDELADLFGNGILSPSPSSITPLSTPIQGEQVSLELLQELRNLTPEAHRNTKMPETVLRELLEKGITVLADGHNPFYTC